MISSFSCPIDFLFVNGPVDRVLYEKGKARGKLNNETREKKYDRYSIMYKITKR